MSRDMASSLWPLDDFRAYAHLTATALWCRLIIGKGCMVVRGWREDEGSRASCLPPGAAKARATHILRFIFQHDSVTHTDFTFLRLELLFV